MSFAFKGKYAKRGREQNTNLVYASILITVAPTLGLKEGNDTLNYSWTRDPVTCGQYE